LDVFTKRVLVEKHNSSIMYKNPEGAQPPLLLSDDADKSSISLMQK